VKDCQGAKGAKVGYIRLHDTTFHLKLAFIQTLGPQGPKGEAGQPGSPGESGTCPLSNYMSHTYFSFTFLGGRRSPW